MVTTTTVYSFQKPDVSGDEDAWGGYLNANIDKYESILTGNTTITSLVITTADINGGTLDNVVIGGSTAAAVTGTTITGTGFASTGNMTFGDNNKAIFGAGSDLQIYHDGSNSYMLEGGTGSLIVGGTNLYLANGDNSKAFLRGTNNADVALYYNNSIKLATTSTGVDVTGTVTADGLTVDESNNVRYSFSESGTGHAYLTIRAGYNTKDSQITFSNNTNSTTGSINYDHTSNFMKFSTNGANERMRIDSSGQVMIGTTSASYPFTVQSTGTSTVHVKTTATNGAAQLRLENDAKAYAVGVGSSDQLYIYDNTNGANRIVVDTNGNVGINKSTPSSYQSYRYLDVAGVSSGQGGVIQVMTSGQEARGQWNVDSGGVRLQAVTNHSLSFYTNATQRMTIASYGNVGIGTSTPTNFSTYRYLDIMGSATTTGGVIQLKTSDSSVNLNMYSYSAGGVFGTATNHNLYFTTNNSTRALIDTSGNLLLGKTSGALGTAGSAFYNYGLVESVRDGDKVMTLNRLTSDGDIIDFRKDGTTVGSIGCNGPQLFIMGRSTDSGIFFGTNNIYPFRTSGVSDDTIDIGHPSYRFDDIYATNGTIQTSDRNEKQDIAELTDAEQRVAVAAKGLLRKFRWKTAVAKKGDEARTHFGIIAQDLQAAFAAEGLDAGDYAMFISSTWTDEETGEERTRMGVRYSELLAFIIAAI
jgi:predicted ABC-type ATPase